MNLILNLLIVLSTVSATTSQAIPNFDTVVPGVYRGAALRKSEDFKKLKEYNVTTVVNLRYFRDNATLCRVNKLNCLHFPLKLYPKLENLLDWRTFINAFEAVLNERKAGRKVYIHCRWGSDRTGALSSALMIRERVCKDPSYEKAKLAVEVRNELHAHNFHQDSFPNLYRTIMSWTETTPDWICADLRITRGRSPTAIARKLASAWG